MNKAIGIALVALLYAGSTAHSQTRSAQFGHEWVRSHPFTLSALMQVPELVEGNTYKNAGFNTFLAWKRPEGLLPIAVSQNLPWQFHVSEDALTADVMNEISSSYANYPGNTGWLIHDEPRRTQMDGVAQIAHWVKQQYPHSLVYTNALPMGADATEYYGDNSHPTYDYSNYLDDLMNIVQPDVLMFDYYPFSPGDDGVSDFYYTNMMKVRQVAKDHNVPYWAFIQAYEKTDKPMDRRLPSESDLRFQMFSLLTAGYTGFHYFGYDLGGWRGVIDSSTGQPTELYARAAAANQEVQTLGNALRFLTSTDVRFIPNGNAAPSLISAWSLGAGDDTLTHVDVDTNAAFGNSTGPGKSGMIGFFTDDNGEKYFMVTNLYHGEDLSAAETLLHFEIRLGPEQPDHVLRLNPLTGETETVYTDAFHTLRLAIPGGMGMLFKYDDGTGFVVPEPGGMALLVVIAGGLMRPWRKSA